jgi:hypothetical protein
VNGRRHRHRSGRSADPVQHLQGGSSQGELRLDARPPPERDVAHETAHTRRLVARHQRAERGDDLRRRQRALRRGRGHRVTQPDERLGHRGVEQLAGLLHRGVVRGGAEGLHELIPPLPERLAGDAVGGLDGGVNLSGGAEEWLPAAERHGGSGSSRTLYPSAALMGEGDGTRGERWGGSLGIYRATALAYRGDASWCPNRTLVGEAA